MESEDTEELAKFRQQWRDELQQRSTDDAERTAREFFLKGVAFERRGNHYEALHFYRQAIHLVPDIESRVSQDENCAFSGTLQNSGKQTLDGTEDQQPLHLDESCVDVQLQRVISSPFIGDVAIWQDQGTSAERFHAGILRLRSVDELEMKVHCLTLQHNFVSCQPLLPQTMLHISSLPREILIYTFRWVVSSDLDMRSLEVLSLVCRGFCYCSRDAELWKLACLKMWGSTAVTKDESISWRQLFISQPHLLFDGVYICQTSYVRVGEPSLDEFYRPFHTVDCYRYLSFYSNGDVLYLNSPDTPVNCVHRLRARASARPVGLQTGHFQLSGDKLFVELEQPQENNESQGRYNSRSHQQLQLTLRTFHMDLKVKSCGRRRCAKLVWLSYSCHTLKKARNQVVVTDFPVNSFTPFYFSRVKSFTANTRGILK